MINGQNVFSQPAKNNLRTYDFIRKNSTGQGDDYVAGCLLDYNYFKNYWKIISKQQALNTDSKAIQQINLTENLDNPNNATIFFITEETKYFGYFTRNCERIVNLMCCKIKDSRK